MTSVLCDWQHNATEANRRIGLQPNQARLVKTACHMQVFAFVSSWRASYGNQVEPIQKEPKS